MGFGKEVVVGRERETERETETEGGGRENVCV
jgi:hypothetical protein